MSYPFPLPTTNVVALSNYTQKVSLSIVYSPNNFFSNATVYPNEEQLKAAEELCHEALKQINEYRKEGESS